MVVAAALFLSLSLLFGIVAAYQQQLETQVQHDGNYRSNRTWTVNYEFMLCGDIRITRIDRQRVDVGAYLIVRPSRLERVGKRGRVRFYA